MQSQKLPRKFFSWLTQINSPGIPVPDFWMQDKPQGLLPHLMVWLLPAGQDAASHLQRRPKKPVFNHAIPWGQKVKKWVKPAQRFG